MPALSKKQQKFMGIVRSIQKGEQPASKFNKDAQDVAKDMKKTDVKKFASTKHKGLPMKKEILGKLKEMIKQELSEYTYGSGDIVKDVNPSCPHYGAQGKVKSVGPKSVVFVVMNKGKNFKPGMELEKSHDQMKKIGESINEMSAKSKKIISKLGKKEKEMFSTMVDMLGFDQVMADYKRDKKAFKQALKDMSESVITEKMSVKSSQEFINNLDQAINLIVKQANNLKGPLAKHPIKRDANKLKAVQTMLKRSILPAMLRYEKENSVEKGYNGVDLTRLKKRLQDGQFKSAVQYSLLPTLDTRSYDSNSFYALNNTKEDKLREKLVKVLRDMTNKMDDAQLENINEKKKMFPPKKMTPKQAKEYKKFIGYAKMGVEYQIDMSLFESVNEDGHTDVASSKRKVMIMVQDSNILLNKLNGMNKEDSLPSWWSDKITLSQNYLAKATDYIINPVESVDEAITGGDRKVLMVIGKEIRDNLLKKHPGLRGNERMLIQGIGATFSSMRFTPDNINYKNYKKYFPKRFNDKLVKRLGDTLAKEKDTVRKTFFKQVIKESMNPSAVKKMRDEFEKTGQLPPHLKKFALDVKILKKKHKVKNIVVPGLEWMSDMKEQSVKEFRDKGEADTARDQIGNKALYMIGAREFVFGTSGGKKSLVFRIMRNSKGVSHIRMRLSSRDLYDMEFLAIRAGKIKVKSKEKGVYGDQLGVMIKKNTGLNVRL